MNKHLFIIGSVTFGVLMFSVALAAPLDTVEATIASLQRQYVQNEEDHARRQNALHRAAESLREVSCALGKTGNCPLKFKINITSYNPEVGQTDGSPCIGAHSTDICELYRTGVRPIAVSRDLLAAGIRYGDKVKLWHPTCAGANGIFQVEDTMNARLSMMADIFSPERSGNVGYCTGGYLKKI